MCNRETAVSGAEVSCAAIVVLSIPSKGKACLGYRLHSCAAPLCQQMYLLWILVKALPVSRQKHLGKGGEGQLPVLLSAALRNILSSSNFSAGAQTLVCTCQVCKCSTRQSSLSPCLRCALWQSDLLSSIR